MLNKAQKRFEHKSLITDKHLFNLAPDPEAIKYNNSNCYTVHSLYYDTKDLKLLNDTSEGILKKIKFRKRDYFEDSYYYECKLKDKHENFKWRFDGDTFQKSFFNDLIKQFSLPIISFEELYPSLEITYQRSSFIFGNCTKVNIDSNIKIFNFRDSKSFFSNEIILEAKGVDLNEIEYFFQNYNLKKSNISKYGLIK